MKEKIKNYILSGYRPGENKKVKRVKTVVRLPKEFYDYIKQSKYPMEWFIETAVYWKIEQHEAWKRGE